VCSIILPGYRSLPFVSPEPVANFGVRLCEFAIVAIQRPIGDLPRRRIPLNMYMRHERDPIVNLSFIKGADIGSDLSIRSFWLGHRPDVTCVDLEIRSINAIQEREPLLVNRFNGSWEIREKEALSRRGALSRGRKRRDWAGERDRHRIALVIFPVFG